MKAGVVEMVYTTDLKSVENKISYRFKSDLRHNNCKEETEAMYERMD